MAKTVIIAVNDPYILYLLQRYAEESGFQATCAPRGKDVLALLSQEVNPALIILDAELAGAPGSREMWGRMRTEAVNRNIPVVIYSCTDESGEERHEGPGAALPQGSRTGLSLQPPVADCLPKSVMYDDFLAALRRAGLSLEPVFP